MSKNIKNKLEKIEKNVIRFMWDSRELASIDLGGYCGEIIFRQVAELNEYLGFDICEADKEIQDFVTKIIEDNWEICEMCVRP